MIPSQPPASLTQLGEASRSEHGDHGCGGTVVVGAQPGELRDARLLCERVEHADERRRHIGLRVPHGEIGQTIERLSKGKAIADTLAKLERFDIRHCRAAVVFPVAC